MKNPIKKLTIGAAMLLCSGSLIAVPITVDEVLFESGFGGDENLLSGSVDVSLSGADLKFTVKNTSGAAGGQISGNLLTGIGFSLPVGVSIVGGNAVIFKYGLPGGSTAHNFTVPNPVGDISMEWGYNNGITSGHFMSPPAQLSYGNAISTMTASVDVIFDTVSPSIDSPDLAGPGFGIRSVSGPSGGLQYVQDKMTFTLNLSESATLAMIDYIENNPVALTFGSSDASTSNVPEGGNTGLLIAGALLGIGFFGRRRN